MQQSALAGCVPSDHFGVTGVRGVSTDEVLVRLGVTDQAPYPLCTSGEALRKFGWGEGTPAVRVCGGEWTFLFDVTAHGKLSNDAVLSHLSAGGEAVSVWSILDGTTRVAHAREGELLADIDAWAVHLTTGADPSRVNRALTEAGFFRDWEDEDGEDGEDGEDDWLVPSAAALIAMEREFGMAVSPVAANGTLPTVSLRHLLG